MTRLTLFVLAAVTMVAFLTVFECEAVYWPPSSVFDKCVDCTRRFGHTFYLSSTNPNGQCGVNLKIYWPNIRLYPTQQSCQILRHQRPFPPISGGNGPVRPVPSTEAYHRCSSCVGQRLLYWFIKGTSVSKCLTFAEVQQQSYPDTGFFQSQSECNNMLYG